MDNWIKREYLLMRSGDKKEEPALLGLQQSFAVDDVIDHVAKHFGVDQGSIQTRKSAHREARRLAMYCVYCYCRHNSTLYDLGRYFSVSGSALTQASEKVAKSSSTKLKKTVKELKTVITKTYN
jgi:chromosomal replication initiation ATPase DnaA